MATYEAIAATGEGLLRLLKDACPADEFPDALFQLYQAVDFQKPMTEGVSLFLYRITVNTSRRNLPPRTDPDGTRYRPPLPLDLHYLLGVWGKTPEKQQRLLGWCIRTLEDVPILPAGLLNQLEPAPPFFPHETVEVICDPLSLTDLFQIWDILKPNVPLSMTYVARFVPIVSKVAMHEYGPVQTRELQFTEGPGA